MAETLSIASTLTAVNTPRPSRNYVTSNTVWKCEMNGTTEYVYVFKVYRDYIDLRRYVGASDSITMTPTKFYKLYTPDTSIEGLKSVKFNRTNH